MMFESEITRSYETTTPMTRGQSQRRHEESRSFRPRLRHAAALAAGLAIALFAVEQSDTTPDCTGEQTVAVAPGDTLTGMAREHVLVTSGRVDFRGVDFTVRRPELLPNDNGSFTNSTMTEVNPGDYLMPGDEVTMPVACEGK